MTDTLIDSQEKEARRLPKLQKTGYYVEGVTVPLSWNDITSDLICKERNACWQAREARTAGCYDCKATASIEVLVKLHAGLGRWSGGEVVGGRSLRN